MLWASHFLHDLTLVARHKEVGGQYLRIHSCLFRTSTPVLAGLATMCGAELLRQVKSALLLRLPTQLSPDLTSGPLQDNQEKFRNGKVDAVDWYLFARTNKFSDLRESCWAFLTHNSSEVRPYFLFYSRAVPFLHPLVTVTVHIEAEGASRKKASLSEGSPEMFSSDMLDVMWFRSSVKACCKSLVEKKWRHQSPSIN